MSRQDANAIFANTSFLYGGNAAYIEDLYAKYEADPAAVDAEWRSFFQSLKDDKSDVVKSARGASWKKPNWPVRPSGDLVAALDGQWAETERRIADKIKKQAQATGVDLGASEVQQAARDSIHALMLIRAYRIRGHFHAKLDPLQLEPEKNEEELDPRSYGFTEADLDRKIYLDRVLGLDFASMREIVAILRRTYCQTLGVEFMHKIQERPVVHEGKIEARPMMYLALSYDHRIVDGREAVTFLVRVKEGLEDPARVVLDL